MGNCSIAFFVCVRPTEGMYIPHAHSHICCHHNHRHYYFGVSSRINKSMNRKRKKIHNQAKNKMRKKPTHKTKITIAIVHIANQRLFTFTNSDFSIPFFALVMSFPWLCELNSFVDRFVSFRCAQIYYVNLDWGPLLLLHGIFKSHIVCYSRDDCMQWTRFFLLFFL